MDTTQPSAPGAKEDSQYVKGLKEHEKMLLASIAKREEHLKTVSGDSKTDYQQTILDEKSRLSQVQKEIKSLS